MDYDEKNSEELEAELYSRIHHEKPETIETTAAVPPPIYSRTVTKHSIVNNGKMNKKASSAKYRKKAIEKCNPNPFAIASAMNQTIPKRLTPYTSYLSQVDSQPIDLPIVQTNDNSKETETKNEKETPDERRPNPFNQGFNRAEEKAKRYQQMQAKKAHASKVREDIRRKREDNIDDKSKQETDIIPTTKSISVPDSDSDDEVYIYPPEEPTVISSDEDDAAEKELEPEAIDNLHDDCDDINVDYDKRLSRHDDPFGGIDVAHLNAIIACPSNNLPTVDESADQFVKPQRANRHSLKRSYDVSETDFAATDVYESESSDLPESSVNKSRKVATVFSGSEGSDIDTTKRSKRMRKRRKSGSNRGSDCISSDDSDDDDDAAYLEPEKTNRPYYLHRGEGVFNAVTKYSKRIIGRRNDQNRDVSLEAADSSDDSQMNGADEEPDNDKGNWVVTDTVGETDDIPIDLNNLEKLTDADSNVVESCANANENVEEENESHVDKDDNNSVRSERLVIHPEMGWNNEMKAFYNDSWGGETHNDKAIRKQMPRDSCEWRLDPKDLRANYNALKTIKCHNCRENGHRVAFCPQPKKQIVCFTCGNGGHREMRCPFAICLRCGEKTNSYRRGCERCFRTSHITCKKCRRRGHLVRDCPDNWRAYHNTIDPDATPVRLPIGRTKKFCSVCSGYGHTAEFCYDFQLFMQDDVVYSDVRHYEKMYPTDDPPIDNSMATPYSMFENPRQNFKFNWNVNESSDRVYGRFMEATKLRRQAEDTAVKRKKVKIPKLNEKMVLNPMNAQNIREKPKKQFAKNFYEESPAKSDADHPGDTTENSYSVPIPDVAVESAAEDVSRKSDECENNDVEMKELDPIEPISVVDKENPDESLCIEPNADEKLMQEAIEVDQLRGSTSFSFCKEMEDLDRSKTLFDLSFIGSGEHEPQEITQSPITPPKVNSKKLRKASEIEQLTEIEISVDKENPDKSLSMEPNADEKLMQEAIEVDELRGSTSFSFCKEMEDLDRSKKLLHLSFIGSGEHAWREITQSPITPTKVTSKKLRKAAEIEQLTEMEISLNKLKDQLSKKKPRNDDIVLNVIDANDQPLYCVHDSDSNYSFGEYFNESKLKENESERGDIAESPDYIPLPPHIDSADLAAAASDEAVTSTLEKSVNSAKIFLTKQHARLLLSTDAGNKLLGDASFTHHVKVRMDWENLGNVLIVVGSTANQNKFHADLIRFLVECCKKMRIKTETFQQIPRSKVALIRFIREQFALLEQPLGNVTELYKNMRRNESLKSKNGTKNADRARKNLNTILMGRAGLRDGRLHLAGLESNLKFLLNNNKDMMTKHMREEIYQHYRYVFSPFEHDNYPELIAEYEQMKRAKTFPPLNIDKSLLEIKISVKDDESVELNRAKQKLMRTGNGNESPKNDQEFADEGSATVDAVLMSEPKTPTPKNVKPRTLKHHAKSPKHEPKTPKQEPKTPKQESKALNQDAKISNGEIEGIESVDLSMNDPVDNLSNVSKNAIWSLKCKDIVEQCRQKHIKSSTVMDKLNSVLEKASRNQLSYADYKNLEKILNTMNNTVN